MKDKIKIFISYSHQDKKYITGFEKYFQPIKNKYSLEIWCDRENKAGKRFQKNR